MEISVVMIVKNGAEILPCCLDSLYAFNDIVVYNNGSTDETAIIASTYKNVQLIEGEFIGFGPTKNIAATYAKNDWILSIDADEVMNEEIVQEILALSYNPDKVYSLLRKNFYKTTEVRHCWGKDEIVRIYNRTITNYSSNHLHEYIITNELLIEKLRNSFNHYPYQKSLDFIIKAERYASLFAVANVGIKKSSPINAFFNGLYAFFRTYILKRGFLDGYAGLLIAFSHMVTNFYKYLALYEMNLLVKELGSVLPINDKIK